MNKYIYTQNNQNIVTTMASEFSRDSLIAWAQSHVPLGCPIFLLTNDELAEMDGSPIEAISFDASKADGKGQVEE